MQLSALPIYLKTKINMNTFKKIGIVSIGLLMLAIAVVPVLGSIGLSDGEATALQIYNLKLTQTVLHDQAEELGKQWDTIEVEIKALEQGLFQVNQ